MKIVVVGMSGFVGTALKNYFQERGDEVLGISIRETTSLDSIVYLIDNSDVCINLAGATIMNRWSEGYKKILRSSRLKTTQTLVEAIKRCINPPSVLLNASAVGVYDDSHQHDESSTYYANDFLAHLVRDWEQSALQAASDNTRVALMRFGVIYGRGGGAMAKMLPPFRLGLGGNMGNGFQIVSWIHLIDLIRAMEFIIQNSSVQGVVNMTSPEPISNMHQTKIMAKILKRPAFFDLPEWLIKIIFGEGSSVMLDSKEVYPKVLQDAGFQFKYSNFEDAFSEIVSQ